MPKRKRRARRKIPWLLIEAAVLVTAFAIYAGIQYFQGRSPAPEPEELPWDITMIGDADIYAAAGFDSEVIGRAREGQIFTLTGRDPSGGWLQFDHDGTPAWIHGGPVLPGSKVFDLPVRGGFMTGKISDPELVINLYSAPDTSSSATGQLTHGDEFNVVGRHEEPGWIFMQADGKQGWAKFNYMRGENDPDLNDLPVITETPVPRR